MQNDVARDGLFGQPQHGHAHRYRGNLLCSGLSVLQLSADGKLVILEVLQIMLQFIVQGLSWRSIATPAGVLAPGQVQVEFVDYYPSKERTACQLSGHPARDTQHRQHKHLPKQRELQAALYCSITIYYCIQW